MLEKTVRQSSGEIGPGNSRSQKLSKTSIVWDSKSILGAAKTALDVFILYCICLWFQTFGFNFTCSSNRFSANFIRSPMSSLSWPSKIIIFVASVSMRRISSFIMISIRLIERSLKSFMRSTD